MPQILIFAMKQLQEVTKLPNNCLTKTFKINERRKKFRIHTLYVLKCITFGLALNGAQLSMSA